MAKVCKATLNEDTMNLLRKGEEQLKGMDYNEHGMKVIKVSDNIAIGSINLEMPISEFLKK